MRSGLCRRRRFSESSSSWPLTKKRSRPDGTGTDDASFVERLGGNVSIALGERSNIKVTTPEDLQWAQWFLGGGIGKEEL